jgi:protein tyrosine phosphatase
MENTRGDFWRLAWEQQSAVILMLTGLEENGQVIDESFRPRVR